MGLEIGPCDIPFIFGLLLWETLQVFMVHIPTNSEPSRDINCGDLINICLCQSPPFHRLWRPHEHHSLLLFTEVIDSTRPPCSDYTLFRFGYDNS